jgi:hypothetical protein
MATRRMATRAAAKTKAAAEAEAEFDGVGALKSIGRRVVTTTIVKKHSLSPDVFDVQPTSNRLRRRIHAAHAAQWLTDPSAAAIKLIGDFGASGHFLTQQALPFLTEVRQTTGKKCVCVRSATGGVMRSTHSGLIPHPKLPRKACLAYVFAEAAASMLSYPQLARGGCKIVLDRHGSTITDAATDEVLEFAPLEAEDNVYMHR